jgi:flagellar assembly protein FliH
MSREYAKFIPGEEIRDAVDWSFTAVDQSASKFAAKLKAQAEAEEQAKIAGVRQLGYAEGHEKGFSEGYAQGHAKATLEGQRQLNDYIQTQGSEAARTFAQLFAAANAQIADAEQVMAKGVLELACDLARQVLRQELSVNPNALLPVIRESMTMLVADSKAATIRLSHQDCEVLGDTLKQELVGMSLSIVADASLSRGGCIVESAGTVIDGTLERRWSRSLANLGLDNAWEVSHASD